MLDKDLKGLNRKDLIEILYQLQKEQQQSQQSITSLERQLADRTIRMENAGSIADAAMEINHIFETAQATADQYLQSIQATNTKIEEKKADTEQECEQALQDTREKALGETTIELPYQVNDGCWFVVGDNRDVSIDSRSSAVGCIPTEQIVGKIVFCVWPLSDFGFTQNSY